MAKSKRELIKAAMQKMRWIHGMSDFEEMLLEYDINTADDSDLDELLGELGASVWDIGVYLRDCDQLLKEAEA